VIRYANIAPKELVPNDEILQVLKGL
jgi:hypothetical protein